MLGVPPLMLPGAGMDQLKARIAERLHTDVVTPLGAFAANESRLRAFSLGAVVARTPQS
ncbi:MAG: hypothetical protein R3F37_13000 [Candidatus Competibacteraceae bacterium]